MEKLEIEKILERYQRNPSQIIAILHEIQDVERYLPEDALRYVADNLNIPVSQIYHIATFYKAFSLKPKGKHICSVCMGTACHVRGAPLVLEELERRLKIKAGDTTPDMEFSLTTVNCVGACALGPVVVVGNSYYGGMNPAKVEKMLNEIREKGLSKEKGLEAKQEEVPEEKGKEKITADAQVSGEIEKPKRKREPKVTGEEPKKRASKPRASKKPTVILKKKKAQEIKDRDGGEEEGGNR